MTVYIADGVRTPIGRYGGALAGVRPDDLAAGALKALVGRNQELDPARIDDVYFGNANGAGEDNRNVARMAVLLAGLPVTVPGATVNRLCGSGMEAVIDATRAIATGDASVSVAGGVESMTRAPWVLPKPSTAFPRGDETLVSTTLGWRLINPAMPTDWTVSLGEGAEILADRYRISRESQDAFAVASHQRAAVAWEAGLFGAEVVSIPGVELTRDESIRPDTSLERLAKLRRCLAEWNDLDPGIVNPRGGAIAIGHPLGCSGARLLVSLAWQLRQRGGGWGLAAMCIGVGQGIAVVLEA
jgi:acetyl-CoA acetyltransferase family protein